MSGSNPGSLYFLINNFLTFLPLSYKIKLIFYSTSNFLNHFHQRINFILFFYKFIYLFLAALGFIAVRGLSLVAASWGLLFIMVRVLLIAVASLVAEHGL